MVIECASVLLSDVGLQVAVNLGYAAWRGDCKAGDWTFVGKLLSFGNAI